MAGNETPATIRLLLVEDDTEFAEMYQVRLELDEYAVKRAHNGREGLTLARAWRPDLIFLDIRMPEIDGLDMLRTLRADPTTAAIPVVVLTNYDDDGLRREAERLGVLQWHLKTDTTPSGIATWVQRWSSEIAEEGGARYR
jgi:CheY-like chemotaxis protein